MRHSLLLLLLINSLRQTSQGRPSYSFQGDDLLYIHIHRHHTAFPETCTHCVFAVRIPPSFATNADVRIETIEKPIGMACAVRR